jgi:hypothetical protein
MVKQRFPITSGIFLILVLAMAFLIMNNPSTQIKEVANFNVVLAVAAGFAIFSGAFFFKIQDRKDFLGDAALGSIIGIVVFVVAGFIIGVLAQNLSNLLALFSSQTLAALYFTQIFFVAEIWPLTETIILVGGTLVVARFLPPMKINKKVDLKYIVAIFIILLFFSAYHFNTYGRGFFEYSGTGFVQFIFNTQGLGQQACNADLGIVTDCYAGALPQFILGGFWIVLALGFKSWVVAWRAHAIANKVVILRVAMSFGTVLDPTILILFVIEAAIIFIAWQRNALAREIGTFKWSNVLGSKT